MEKDIAKIWGLLIVCLSMVLLYFSEFKYAYFIVGILIFNYIVLSVLKKKEIKKKILFVTNLFVIIMNICFFCFKMIPYYQLTGETGKLMATQSNYYNPLNGYYLSDNIFYTLVKNRNVIISQNGKWCEKYFQALAKKVTINEQIKGYENFSKQNNEIQFINVGGMTLVCNSNLFDEMTLEILKTKSNLANYEGYPQLFINTVGMESGDILVMTDSNYNIYIMSYEGYLNEK